MRFIFFFVMTFYEVFFDCGTNPVIFFFFFLFLFFWFLFFSGVYGFRVNSGPILYLNWFFFFPFFFNIFVPLLLFLWLRFPFRLPFLFFDSSSWFLYSLSVLCCCCVSADDIALNLQHHLASPPSPWPLLSHPAARFPPPFPIDMQMPPEAQ